MIAFFRSRYRFYRYVILGFLMALILMVFTFSRWAIAQDNPNIELVRSSIYQHLLEPIIERGDHYQASLLSIPETVLFSSSGKSALTGWFLGESGGFGIVTYDESSNAWIFKCSWGGGLAEPELVAEDCDIPVGEVRSLFDAERQREAEEAEAIGVPLDYQ